MKGYRTLVFNAIMAILAGLSMTGVLGSDNMPSADQVNEGLDALDKFLLFATPIGNAILRFMTTTTVGQKS